MARYIRVHPQDPQPRFIAQIVSIIRSGGLIAYPTDSGYALGTALGNKQGLDRIRSIRHLTERHNYTLVCHDLAQLGQYVHMDNDIFRAIKAVTPGSYTFILKATREAPRIMQQPKRKTIGVRIPDHPTALAILAELGEPLMSSTLILPGQDEPLTEGWLVEDQIGHQVDAIVDSGTCGDQPTTVVDASGEEIVVTRVGGGDISLFS